MKKQFPWKTILLFLGLASLYHFRILFFNQSFFSNDLIQQFYPFKEYARQAFHENRVPLWSNGILCGIPFLATILSFFYPFNFLFWYLPFPRALSFFIGLHSWLAGLFMYFYLGNLKLNREARLIGSILFMANGFLFREVIHPDTLTASIYTPLILCFIDRLLLNPSALNSFGLGISVSCSLLAGNPQITYGISLLAFSYGVFRITSQKIKSITQSFLWLVVGLLLGVGLSLIQYLPSWELTRFSLRSAGINFSDSAYGSLEPLNLLGYFFPKLPDLFQNFDGFMGWEGYLGVIPFIFLLFLPRRKETYFFVCAAVIIIFITLGKYSPLGFYRLFHYLVPGFKFFRSPFRYVYLYVFSFAVLAALGVDNMKHWSLFSVEKRQHRFIALIMFIFLVGLISLGSVFLLKGIFKEGILRNGITFILGCILILLYQKDFFSYRKLVFALCIFIIGDLFLTFSLRGWPPVGPDNIYQLENESALVKTLPKKNYPPRIFQDYFIPLPNTVIPPCSTAELFPKNFGLIFGVSHILGYHPFGLQYYVEFLQRLSINQVLSLTATEYILGPAREKLPWPVIARDDYTTIYQNPSFLPRAFVAYNWINIASSDDVFQHLQKLYPRLDKIAVISSQDPPSPKPFVNMQVRPAQIESFQSEKVVVSVKLEHPGILVLNEVYYPGWRVFAAKQELPLLRVNGVFRGVYLQPGQHEVFFNYQPVPYQIGKKLSLLSAVGLLCLLVYGLFKEKTKKIKGEL